MSARLFGNAVAICASPPRLSTCEPLTCPPLPDPSRLVVANVWAAHASPVETCCGPDPVDDGAIVLVRVFRCPLNLLLPVGGVREAFVDEMTK